AAAVPPPRSLATAKRTYTIRTVPDTTDRDEIEPTAPAPFAAPSVAAAPSTAAPSAAVAVPAADRYQGTARKAAKLSIAAAPVESIADLNDLIASLPAESSMVHHHPPITTQATSNRVAEE